MPSSVTRFTIQGPEGAEEAIKLPSPNAVLSRAVTYATRATKPGVWRVREYEDTLYTVRRLEGAKPTITVEVA